jgi:hypothetical protein
VGQLSLAISTCLQVALDLSGSRGELGRFIPVTLIKMSFRPSLLLQFTGILTLGVGDAAVCAPYITDVVVLSVYVLILPLG